MIFFPFIATPPEPVTPPPAEVCEYGSTGAYMAPDMFEELDDICWWVSFDVNTMNIPDDSEIVSTIRLQQDDGRGYVHQWYGDKSSEYPAFDSPEFAEIIQGRPGSVWVIGNEMENPQQDNLHFSAYAVAYHDAYHAIKAADPSARVAVGAITSLGPGNIEYLGQFVNQYADLYGTIPPADVWTIHTYNTVPLSAADDTELLDSQLTNFLNYLAFWGYDVPVWVTEFGILPPADYIDENGQPFTPERAGEYMTAAIEIFKAHGIERWSWYSAYVAEGDPGDSGNLINADGVLTPLGMIYGP